MELIELAALTRKSSALALSPQELIVKYNLHGQFTIRCIYKRCLTSCAGLFQYLFRVRLRFQTAPLRLCRLGLGLKIGTYC